MSLAYRLTREEFNPFINDSAGNFGTYSHYKIFEEEILVAELHCKNIISFFNVGLKEYSIFKKNSFSPSKKWIVAEKLTKQVHGQISYSILHSFFSKNVGKMELGEKKICLKKENSYPVANPLLGGSKLTTASYTLGGDTSIKIFYPISGNEEVLLNKPEGLLTGTISTNSSLSINIMSGLFLIEQYLFS